MKYYYHGTAIHNLQSILKYGLQPQERTGDSPYWNHVTRRIYLLDSPEEVEWYAHPGGAILRVRIPPNIKVRQSMYAEGHYVTKPIPPEYIEVYKTVPQRL